MRADVLKALVEAHTVEDDAAFRRAVLQLAAVESAAGHGKIADELRAMALKLTRRDRAPASVADLGAPRGDLADILDGGFRKERFEDIVLDTETRALLERVVLENRSRAKLESFGVSPRRKLLLHGPPGCGKTLAASVLAGELGLPLLVVRLDGLFSRFLGATAQHLRTIFAEMSRRPAVYLFDELDAVTKARGSETDVGEMHRIVTAFLQLLDNDTSASLIIATTNHHELIDRAVFRRFDLLIPLGLPSPSQAEQFLLLRLARFGLTKKLATRVARDAAHLTFADLARACDDTVRQLAIEGREALSVSDLQSAMAAQHKRAQPGKPT